MDADYVNMFIQKQKDLINELMVKVIMLETRVTLQEKSLGENAQALHDLGTKAAGNEEELKASKAMIEKLKTELSDRNRTIEQMTAQKTSLEQQIATLKSLAKTNVDNIIAKT